jgi:signal transduction histidine kinase/DNA-binding response OmpR family regulator
MAKLPELSADRVIPQPQAEVGHAQNDTRINILIVDDEPKNLAVLETILADENYRLVRAENANQALLALLKEEFALIILDIRMPEMSGLELAQIIKERKKTAVVPIIFLTAYLHEDEHVLTGYETGAVDYLHKPVNATILRSKVAVFAELHRKNREVDIVNRALRAEITERRRIEDEIRLLNSELESRVEARTAEIFEVNAALRESDRLLRLSQQAGKVGLWDWDLAAGIGTWTEAARDIFQLPNSSGQVSTAEWLSCVHPDDRERITNARELAKQTGTYNQEYRIVTPANEIRWIESIGAIEYKGQTAIRMRGSVRDITDRKRIELRLIETDRRKDEFLAMLGHELRNPLAAIRNAISILDHSGDGHEYLNLCREVLDRQTEHLTHLVNDLLDVSRITSGKIQLHQECFELSRAILQAVETNRPLLDQRGHRLEVTLTGDLLYVMGDPVRLAQAIGNLLNNAAKYTDPGGQILVSLEHHRESNQAVVRVRDNGRGLDASSLEHLFELFYQVDRNLDRSEGGLGIGLSLVHRLIEMHGGSITADSAGTGQGSEFIISLPCVTPPPQHEVHVSSESQQINSDLTILVVDDNIDSAKSMETLLQLIGHQTLIAYDGQTAVEVAIQQRPTAILLDIGLPGLDGYQVCRQLRAQGLSETFIVAMTGYGLESDRQRTKEAGFNEHLVKPLNLTVLQELLSNLQSQSFA